MQLMSYVISVYFILVSLRFASREKQQVAFLYCRLYFRPRLEDFMKHKPPPKNPIIVTIGDRDGWWCAVDGKSWCGCYQGRIQGEI